MPEYVARIWFSPEGSDDVEHVACPLPFTATAPQPLMIVPSAVNSTVPTVTGTGVTAASSTVAVNVTVAPGAAGLRLLASCVVVPSA